MRILIAEDEPVSRRLLVTLLTAAGHEVEAVPNGRQALDRLEQRGSPQLAILDWVMPELEGIEVCRRLRSLPGVPYRYVMLLTSRTDRSDLVEGLRAGADDFLSKPYDVDELLARVRTGERILALQAELIEARDRLRIEATHDALTDLLNRRAIMELLDREVERAHREQLDLSVVMLDLDHFKMVNDQLGHSAGDEVLRDSAALLRRLLRSYDAIGRYGGEEFIVVLPGCDLETAQFVAERLRAALAAHTVAFDELSIPVTASFGAAALQMRQDSCELVRRADSAMYRAKKRGRNCVACDGADGVLQAV